ncbi:MAG TPA: TonB family protein [Gemmatimonadales bacterium]|nr:TonB family protein [Gemmatimonadales bacterium]
MTRSTRLLVALMFLNVPAAAQVPLRSVPLGATPSRVAGEIPVPHRIVPEESVCSEELPHSLIVMPDTIFRDSSYTEASVDRPPDLIKVGKRRYPTDLQRAGVGGRVVFSFIIDTLGHPEPCSFHVHSVVDPRLEVAALRMVLESLFRPGEVRGQKVRVLVNQAVTFNP